MGENSVPPPDAEMVKSPEADELDKGNPTVEKIKSIFHVYFSLFFA